MNKSKKVSILIVTFNAERFIRETITSCLRQSYNNYEILILDNNSQDKTVEILKSFGDDRIFIFPNKKNIGPYAGLNFLIKKSSGEYIAILDHDDMWLPIKIQTQVLFLQKHPYLTACGTGYYTFYEKFHTLIGSKPKSKNPKYVAHTSLLFRNNGYLYNPTHPFSDEKFIRETLGSNYKKVGLITKKLVLHRIRSDRENLSHKRISLKWKDIISLISTRKKDPKMMSQIFYEIIAKLLPQKTLFSLHKKLSLKKDIYTRKEFQQLYKDLTF